MDESIFVRVELISLPVVYIKLTQIMQTLQHFKLLPVLHTLNQYPDVPKYRLFLLALDIFEDVIPASVTP